MKLAVISTHPIQYYAPWFGRLAAEPGLTLRVFYLWDFGVTERLDRGFGRPLKWDISLLDGYGHEFVPNTSPSPGTHHFRGLRNPDLVGRVRRYAPDAVLLLGYNYSSLYEFILRWDRRKAPLIFRGDSHRLVERRGYKELLRRRFISTIFGRFERFLYVGRANYGYFRYHGVAPGKLFFAPHAVNNERFFGESGRASEGAREWRKELGIPAEHQVVLFAGKLEEKKRPLDLMGAFEQARPQSASLLFVGSGHLEPELLRRASGSRNVYFAPFQNQSMMPRTYAASDLFVLPSCGPGETWGLAVNEAMCLSRAVVTSTHVGCAPDLVRNGSNGLVFEAGSVQALADTLTEALSDRERLGRWGAEGRRIIDGYSYEETTRGLMGALASLG